MNLEGVMNILDATFNDCLKIGADKTRDKARLHYVTKSPIFELWAFVSDVDKDLYKRLVLNRVYESNNAYSYLFRKKKRSAKKNVNKSK